MSELLKKIKGNTYYVKGPVNAGIYLYDSSRCVVIDTGLDDDAGRKILKATEQEGWTIDTIINTHAHADHFGGNSFLVRRTGARVVASGIEGAIIRHPYLEPFYLYSAHPMESLRNKFLMGKESPVDGCLDTGEMDLGGEKLDIVDLKGHSPGQIGVATPDNVLFTADAYFSSSIIQKYRLPYFTNIRDTVNTLDSLGEMHYEYYLPCHGDCATDISEEIEMNLKAIYHTMDLIGIIASGAVSREQVVSAIVREYNIKLHPGQYYLTLSSVSAYLSYMTDEGMLESILDDNLLKWRKA